MKLPSCARPATIAAATALAVLALTGYTVAPTNLIVWSYLGQTNATPSPYNASGVAVHSGYSNAYPANLPVPSMPSDFNARIALMLPEKVDIRSNKNIVLSNDDQTNIKLTAPAEVWVTFLNEGAGFLNSVGFFTFDPANPPTKPSDVTDEQIIIPNASIPPLAAATTQGATVYLGSFPAGRAIGFFVVANGWSATGRKLGNTNVPGVKEAIDRNWIYYSVKGLNPEPATGNLNQHTVLLNDQELTGTNGNKYQRLVLGFEDYLRTSSSDHDFNDVILAVHVSPSASISNLAGLPQLVRESTGERIKPAAQRVHDERKAELHKQPKLKGRKWSDAVVKWLETKNPSADEVASLLRFSKLYHDRLLTSVTPESIEDVLGINCNSAATYNRRRARIQGVLACVKIKLDIPKRAEGVQPEPRWLRPHEWVDLYAELPAHMKDWAQFSITTGLRQANVLGLRWDQVDMKRRYCWIERDTAKGKRSFQVPLNKEALDVLKTVQDDHPEFCFTYQGRPVTEIKTAFTKACVRAGLGRIVKTETGSSYSGFTWHGFRHTWATWHVQNGTPLTVLQQLGAWSSYAMVLIYAHHAPSFLATYADNSTFKDEENENK